jgi:mannose-6-phosphate isomerase-like protein (cupin superfamily)
MDARYLDKVVSPVIAGLVLSAIGLASLPAGAASALTDAGPDGPIFKQLPEVQWAKMLPELGEASPEMAILHEDPKTHATQLLIRSPKALHVRKHWHSANETHTVITGTATFECGGKKAEFGPGGFNYIPARMVHEAWTGPGSVPETVTSSVASNPNDIVNIAADLSGSSTSAPALKSNAPPSGEVSVFANAGVQSFTLPAAVKLAADNRRSSALM